MKVFRLTPYNELNFSGGKLMTIEIRKLTINDLESLQRISIETFSDTFAAYNDPKNLDDYLKEAYSQDSLRKQLMDENSHFYYIYFNEKKAGYMKLNEYHSQTETHNINDLEVERIYIKKVFKRMGLGRELIDFSLKRAKEKGKENIWLGVWEKNQAAIDFYTSLGFKLISQHDFFMGTDKQTDYIMQKKIESI